MVDFASELKSITAQLESLSSELNRLDGQKTLLDTQITSAKDSISKLEHKRNVETKATEVLHAVQRATRDKMKEAFENTVTYALKSIYQDDYRFQLEFDQRGNIGELNFKLKTPTTEGYLDLEECTAGGVYDIISLALRFVLLQVMVPKPEGMVVLDEPTKQLSWEYRQNEFAFYEAMSEKLNRQLIIITHSKELIDMATNKIQIGD